MQFSPAVLVGLEPHLTVPSRYHTGCVDLWFSLTRCSASADWDAQFKAIAQNRKQEFPIEREIELLSFTPERGWLVLRGVREGQASVAVLEAQLNGIVESVNEL